MKDHNGVLMMQRVLLAGTLGMAMARKAAAILEGDPGRGSQGTQGSGAGGSREAEVAKALGRGDRVKLHNAAAIWSACRPQVT